MAGYGGYESLGRVVLLRSIVVIVARRNGVGRAIAETILTQASSKGGEVAFLLTEDAAGFFTRLGFEVIPRDNTPAVVKNHPQFDRLCPETSLIMQKRL